MSPALERLEALALPALALFGGLVDRTESVHPGRKTWLHDPLGEIPNPFDRREKARIVTAKPDFLLHFANVAEFSQSKGNTRYFHLVAGRLGGSNDYRGEDTEATNRWIPIAWCATIEKECR